MAGKRIFYFSVIQVVLLSINSGALSSFPSCKNYLNLYENFARRVDEFMDEIIDLNETFVENITVLTINRNLNKPNVGSVIEPYNITDEDNPASNVRGRFEERNQSLPLDRSHKEVDILGTIPTRWFGALPPFDPARSRKVSPQCRLQTIQYMKALERFDMWALKLYDSSAKLPSGLLNGNVNQYGDFDQCLSAQNDNLGGKDIRGQYCMAYLEVTVPQEPENNKLRAIHRLVQSHFAFKSDLTDPGHRVPRYSTINWALCVPSACNHQDVQFSLEKTLSSYVRDTGVRIRVKVDDEMCQKKTEFNLSSGTIIAGIFFLCIILITAISTVYEMYSEKPLEVLTVFSLKRNVLSLISITPTDSDIHAVHGIRFLNAIMLIIAHKSMALFFNPYINRTSMTELLGQPWSVIGRAASLYTDPFIMLSGLLTAHALIGRLQKGQPLRVLQEYCGRLLRIVPPLGALILFCTFILPLLGSGPQWNLVVTHHADICKKVWWRNILFIHNYFGFENMCLTHTHHVGIDTQLFLTAPLLVTLLWKWPRRGASILLAIAAVSTAARFYVTMTKNLSNYVFFGTSVSQLFDTANYMYILPAHRATVYIMGVLLAAVLRTMPHIRLSKTQIRIGWTTAVLLFAAAFFGPAPMGSITYIYNAEHAAHYAAFAPIAWCAFFGWIIFTSQMGYHSGLSKFFSWRIFLVTTRLSYALYLTQFPVFFYNVGGTRSSEHYNFLRMMLNVKEYFWIAVCSVTLTLLFDSPFQNIKKILFRRTPSTNQHLKKKQ